MTKSQLIEKLTERKNISKTQAEEVVNTIFEAMKDALMRQERIEIRGFGSFTIRHYKEYTARNPKTTEPVKVPPKILPFFKVGKELREMINKNFKKESSKSEK